MLVSGGIFAENVSLDVGDVPYAARPHRHRRDHPFCPGVGPPATCTRTGTACGIFCSKSSACRWTFSCGFNAVQNPTILLLTYVLIGNSIAGLFFSWLYWKKGLEAAFIGHIFAHVAMIIGEQVFQFQ
jgi:hypothetical protein